MTSSVNNLHRVVGTWKRNSVNRGILRRYETWIFKDEYDFGKLLVRTLWPLCVGVRVWISNQMLNIYKHLVEIKLFALLLGVFSDKPPSIPAITWFSKYIFLWVKLIHIERQRERRSRSCADCVILYFSHAMLKNLDIRDRLLRFTLPITSTSPLGSSD